MSARATSTRALRALVSLLFLAPLLTAADCDTYDYPDEIRLYGLTSPPPSRTAQLTNDFDADGGTIRISRGVGLVLACRDTCESVCLGPEFAIEDDSVAELLPAESPQNRTDDLYVLIGKLPGQTTLRVSTPCAEATYQVNVEPVASE